MALFSVPTWGKSSGLAAIGGAVQVADVSAAPSLGEARIMPLTAEQLGTELAAAERKHDAVIQANIVDASERGRTEIESLLRRLLNEGTAPEKAGYANSTGKVYRLPEHLQIREDKARFRLAFDRGIECRRHRCIRYAPEQTCSDRSICRMVCQAASGAAGGAIGGASGGAIGAVVGGEVCTQVCQTLPECRTIDVCQEWEYRGFC